MKTLVKSERLTEAFSAGDDDGRSERDKLSFKTVLLSFLPSSILSETDGELCDRDKKTLILASMTG